MPQEGQRMPLASHLLKFVLFFSFLAILGLSFPLRESPRRPAVSADLPLREAVEAQPLEPDDFPGYECAICKAAVGDPEEEGDASDLVGYKHACFTGDGGTDGDYTEQCQGYLCEACGSKVGHGDGSGWLRCEAAENEWEGCGRLPRGCGKLRCPGCIWLCDCDWCFGKCECEQGDRRGAGTAAPTGEKRECFMCNERMVCEACGHKCDHCLPPASYMCAECAEEHLEPCQGCRGCGVRVCLDCSTSYSRGWCECHYTRQEEDSDDEENWRYGRRYGDDDDGYPEDSHDGGFDRGYFDPENGDHLPLDIWA